MKRRRSRRIGDRVVLDWAAKNGLKLSGAAARAYCRLTTPERAQILKAHRRLNQQLLVSHRLPDGSVIQMYAGEVPSL